MATFDRKDDYLYVRWAQEVKKRDHFTCQICGKQGNELNAHHKNAWASYPDQRYDIDNGVTLCAGFSNGKQSCHELFHSIYGKGDNTEDQYDEFVLFCDRIFKFAHKKVAVEAVRERVISSIRDGYESQQ